MNIDCINGIDDKINVLKNEIKKRGLEPEDVCFVGNDINDIECIKYVKLGVAVNNAYPEVKKAAKKITQKNGGEGAVREVVDMILD